MTNITKHRYSDLELAEFKVLIDDKLEKANNELQFLRDQMLEINENNSNQQSGDWTDESSSHTELEMLNSMINRQHQFIQNLENALIRIHNKTYGVCAISGELIDKKRLYLVPHATKSVEAKASQVEKRADANSKIRSIDNDENDTADYSERDTNLNPEFFD
jgi:DnaK suppressor protein